MESKQYKNLFRIVQIAAIGLFFGRAYQHLFWDAPFRAFFWDEKWMSFWVEQFSNLTWQEYSTSLAVDDSIQNLKFGFGILYLVAGIFAIFAKQIPRVLHFAWLFGSISLVFLAGLYCKEKFYSAGQFFEYSLQFCTPLILYYLIRKQEEEEEPIFFNTSFILFLKIIIALTFTCHGLYALNFYPVPGHFMDMTINILGVSDGNAKLFLKLAGILDFVAALLIFLPRKWAMLGLAYAIFWGFMTTIARIWGHFYWDFPWESLHQWAHESLYRIPHFLIPLFLLLYYFYTKGLSK